VRLLAMIAIGGLRVGSAAWHRQRGTETGAAYAKKVISAVRVELRKIAAESQRR
jgi:hypothetical protein